MGLGGRSLFLADGPDDPIPLNDDHYLRLMMILYIEDTGEGPRAKVKRSSFQYQMDREGKQWVFRYEYLRTPPDPHPAAHLQIRGNLTESCLPQGESFERVHFPTQRVALEAMIRLLADQFKVPCNGPTELWRPVLAESEALFLDITHRPLSGPDR